ncbi:FkbM family methyltransferase, partial [bacterium]|nr:FkbM family methyltransferase [bacterium]
KHIKTFFKEKTLDICIDVGGHRGSYSKELLKQFNINNLIIFEPSIQNFNYLEVLFKDENIKVEPLAVSNELGNQMFYYNNKKSSLSSLYSRSIFIDNEDIISYEVEVTSLYEYISRNFPNKVIDFIKIDTEGNEYKVIKGLGSKIKMVKVIQFEFGSTTVDTLISFFEFWKLLKKNNFKLFRMGPNNLFQIHSYSNEDEHIEYSNFIAVNEKYI